MGINTQVMKTLLHENAYKPFHGNCLLVGKSTVTISEERLREIINSYSIIWPTKANVISDTVTRHSSDRYCFDDVELLKAIFPAIESIDVLDVSPYEGANVVADLNKPIEDNLKYKYDLIYDSSVLDNVFNPAQMIMNLTHMLKPHGRMIGINVSSFYPGAMCSCHPEWFYGFFAANDFEDAKVYVTQQNVTGISNHEYATTLWRYKPSFTRQKNYNYLDAVNKTSGIFYTIYIAEAGLSIPDELNQPFNLQYIDSSTALDWSSKQSLFDASDRPMMKASNLMPSPHLTSPHLTSPITMSI